MYIFLLDFELNVLAQTNNRHRLVYTFNAASIRTTSPSINCETQKSLATCNLRCLHEDMMEGYGQPFTCSLVLGQSPRNRPSRLVFETYEFRNPSLETCKRKVVFFFKTGKFCADV